MDGRAHGRFVDLGHFDKDFIKNAWEREVTQESILEFRLLDTFKTTFLMENVFVMEVIFSIFNKIRVGFPPPQLVHF